MHTAQRRFLPARPAGAAVGLAIAALLAGCAGGPRRATGDGPPADPPPHLAAVPDAEPRIEPIRSGGPNKPYEVLGRGYVPLTGDAPFRERGLASWYGRQFNGKPTSSGEPYDMYAMTAAHPTLPIPSYARIRNPANGREVVVRINDRGPFHPGRIVDLSYTAALKLDLLRGVAPVELERLTFDDIRTGAWRRPGADAGTLLASSASAAAAVPTPAPTPTPLPLPAPASASAAPLSPAVTTPAAVPLPVAAAAVGVPANAVAEVATEPAERLPMPSPGEPPAPGAAPAARVGFFVQLGAFRLRDGAESFQQRIAAEQSWLGPWLGIAEEASLYRLQAGPYPTREDARAAAARVREGLRLVPVIVERR